MQGSGSEDEAGSDSLNGGDDESSVSQDGSVHGSDGYESLAEEVSS